MKKSCDTPKKLSPKERLSLTVRAFGLIKKYCPGLIEATTIKSLVSALQPFATIWFSAQILNEITLGKNLQKTIVLAVAVVLINFVLSVIKGRIDIIQNEKEGQMWCYFGKIFADKQMSLDFADVENAAVQKRKTREKENLFMLGNGLGQFIWTVDDIIEGLVSVFTSVLMVITLFTAQSQNPVMNSPLWVLLIVGVIVFGAFINYKIFIKNAQVSEGQLNLISDRHHIISFFDFKLCQEFDRAMDVRMYRQNTTAHNIMADYISKSREEEHLDSRYAKNEGAASVISGLAHVVTYVFVTLKAFYGAFPVGSIIQYVGALSKLASGLQKLIFGITDNAVYTIHLKTLFEFLDYPNKKYIGTLPVEKRTDNEYDIEFKNVSFKYPGSKAYALKNLNMKFTIGKRLAVVGMNGSGKTTMIKLLCRLYDPTEGEITLNGINIMKYKYDEYMDVFSVVFQDFKLFSLPLAQNVSAGMNFNEKRVKECLTQAGFSERLKTLRAGIHTYLYKDFGENGVEISGGEAQKIALARAIYKNAPFIILDEPTAALDPFAEFEIYTKFNELVGDSTAVYISHRLASCRFCDDIAVFHEGELIQRGNHSQLVSEKQGEYFELWNAQAQYYEK